MDRKIISPFIFAVSILCSHSFGQVSVSDDIYSNEIITDTIEEIVPEAHYTEIILDSVIHAGDDLADVLGREPGIIYHKNGAAGSCGTVSIRGIDSKKILVYLDGIPLNSSMGGAADLSQINPEMIEAIEVYKGYIPARFGGNGLGGVINLRKKQSVDGGRNLELSVLYGSFGEQKYHMGTWFVPHYLLDIYSTLDFHYAKNDYPYLDRNRTPSNTDDDTIRFMNNDEYRDFEFRFTPSIALKNDKKIMLDIFIGNTLKEIPAENGYVNHTAESGGNEFDSKLVFLNFLNSEKLKSKILINYNYQNNRTFATDKDKFGISHGTFVDGDWIEFKYKNYLTNLNSLIDLTINKYLSLETHIDADYEIFIPNNKLRQDIMGDWECFSLKGKIASDFKFISEYITAQLGLSGNAFMDSTNGGWDEYLEYYLEQDRDFRVAWSANVAVGGFLPGKNVNWFANGGRNYKAPTLRERFGFKGGVVPNPELQDEVSYSFDLGLGINLKIIQGETSFFYSRSKNGIVFVSDQYLSKPQNVDDSEVYGVEIGLTWKLHEKLSCLTNATWQNAKMKHPSGKIKTIPDQPDFALYTSTTIGPFYGLSFLWDVQYKSTYYKDVMNSYAVPSDTSKCGYGNNSFGLKLSKGKFIFETIIKGLPLNLFDIDLYGDYSLEHINEGPSSGGGYYWSNHPGIRYQFKANFTF